MTYPAYIRDKARQMRSEKRLSIDEIAERLAISRSTIYHWVRAIEIPRAEFEARVPVGRRHGSAIGRRKGNATMQANFAAKREMAYDRGRGEFIELSRDPLFAQFLCLYIAEGYKRNRNTASLGNSDPAVVLLAAVWLRRFTKRPMYYAIQYHADQDQGALRSFWARALGIDPEEIRLQRKSNSNQLAGRTWRCEYGVLTVGTHDTELRARLQGWIDELRETWPKIPHFGA